MNRVKTILFLMLLGVFAVGLSRAADEKKAEAKAGKKTAAELEKEKALADPYPNDLGPDSIDISAYPKEYKKGYDLLKQRCAKCHTASRPLNSRFVETAGKDDAAKKATLAALQKSNPEMFGDKALGIWQIEEAIWKRYVKRMAAKPGCDIAGPEAKTIWEFLVYDSNSRKMGAAAAKWKAHREDLLKKFKAKHPKRYEELHEQKDL